MKYMGSKNRHAKELLPIILKNRNKSQWYVEPFVGGFNIIDKVSGKRLANDNNYYLIELFKAVQNGWKPPVRLSEKKYKDVKNSKDNYPSYLVGFIGFGCSYSGKWFGGYARGNSNNGKPRNYCGESRNNILAQVDNIQGVTIHNKEFYKLRIPNNSIIYCDPPYANTTKYKDEFDHKLFWDWCRQKVKDGHQVFVSEYNAPSDFVEVWRKKVNNTLVKNTGSKQGVEKLFIHASQKDGIIK